MKYFGIQGIPGAGSGNVQFREGQKGERGEMGEAGLQGLQGERVSERLLVFDLVLKIFFR